LTEAASVRPERVAVPSSATSNLPSTGENVPRNVPTMYSTANPTWEWAASSCHVPIGRAVRFPVVVVMLLQTSVEKYLRTQV
jgi:hypothetical protein